MARTFPAYHSYVEELFATHDVPYAPVDSGVGGPMVSDEVGHQLFDVAMSHPIGLIANALGVPPDYMIEAAKEREVPLRHSSAPRSRPEAGRGRCGSDRCPGHRSRGHCGEVTTMVLIPEVIEAIAPVREVPVLAAGGHRRWQTGGRRGRDWCRRCLDRLGVAHHRRSRDRAHTVQKMLAVTSRDTIRSAGRTGKPSRQLVSDWTDAWAPRRGGHHALPLPLQAILSEPASRRVDALTTYWVGQGVGLMNRVQPARQVVLEFIEDYANATERLISSLPG
jgi:NAD(P)H-dependent flavin oxidoreductase YrpB (nitropropane dioxygenase family)